MLLTMYSAREVARAVTACGTGVFRLPAFAIATVFGRSVIVRRGATFQPGSEVQLLFEGLQINEQALDRLITLIAVLAECLINDVFQLSGRVRSRVESG
mgnify:CR=1 FL=1